MTEELLQQLRRSSSFRTICEVHREIYEATTDERLRGLVLEAFAMAKKMDAKLREYKADWDAGFYQKNHDHKQDSQRRKASCASL